MFDFGIPATAMFSVAVGVVLAAVGFRLGVRLRFLDPKAPELTAVVGFVAGFLLAPAVALGAAAILIGLALLWAYKLRGELRAQLERFLDRVAVERGTAHRRRPFDELVREEEADHRQRMKTIYSADHDRDLRDILLDQEQARHREALTQLAAGGNLNARH